MCQGRRKSSHKKTGEKDPTRKWGGQWPPRLSPFLYSVTVTWMAYSAVPRWVWAEVHSAVIS